MISKFKKEKVNVTGKIIVLYLFKLKVAFRKKKLMCFFFFLGALGLRCCVQAFSSCGERGLLFIAVRGLLIAVASLVAEHGL